MTDRSGMEGRDAREQGRSVHGPRHTGGSEPIAPGLHVVATPIGNLGDISLRALATLAAAEAVLAEDTRVTKTLLAHYGIATPLVAYHEHNAGDGAPAAPARLRGGRGAGAGVRRRHAAGLRSRLQAGRRGARGGDPVTAVPGASAVLAALVVAGLPTDRFFFEGFLPPKSGARRARIAELAACPARSCSSNRPAGWPRRWPTSRRCWAPATPRSPAS